MAAFVADSGTGQVIELDLLNNKPVFSVPSGSGTNDVVWTIAGPA